MHGADSQLQLLCGVHWGGGSRGRRVAPRFLRCCCCLVLLLLLLLLFPALVIRVCEAARDVDVPAATLTLPLFLAIALLLPVIVFPLLFDGHAPVAGPHREVRAQSQLLMCLRPMRLRAPPGHGRPPRPREARGDGCGGGTAEATTELLLLLPVLRSRGAERARH